MERVGVLHRKLAHANQPTAAARLVAELRLYLVEHKWVLRVRHRLAARKVYHRFLVRHAEQHVHPGAVLEAHQLAADALPPARLLPQFRRKHDRHQHLLPVDCVHLLPDNILNFGRDALCRRQKRVYPVRHLPHIAPAQEEYVAHHRRVSRFLLVPLAQKPAH